MSDKRQQHNDSLPDPSKKRAVQIPPPRKASKNWPRIVSKDFILFFEKCFFQWGRFQQKNLWKRGNFYESLDVCSEEFFFREEKLVVYKVQQRGLCPAAKLRGQGKGGCACRFLICLFLCHERHMFLHRGCAKNFLFGSTLEKRWPVLREHAFSEMNSLLQSFGGNEGKNPHQSSRC